METTIAQIGTALFEHSEVWSDTIGRGRRTQYNVMHVVYSDDQQSWGHKVRDFHKPVKGKMDDGARYHALNPELWYWIHSTFIEMVIYNTDMFVRRLSDEQKAQIFEEGKAWYELYGVSSRSQPQTYEEFRHYWDDMLDRAVPTHTAMYGTGYLRKGLPRPKKMPAPLWRLLSAPLNVYGQSILVGTIPPQVRTALRLEWSDAHERRFQRFAAAVRGLNPIIRRLPVRLTYTPWAAQGWAREGIDPRKIHN